MSEWLMLSTSYFQTLHTTAFLYVRVYFGVLQKHSAGVTRSDTLWGSKPPHLQLRSAQIVSNSVCRLRSSFAIDLFCSVNFYFRRCGDAVIQSNCIFLLDSHQ